MKGIVLGVSPQGEYGRRLLLLTDRFGKTTVFAAGAAKPGSHLIGATRPMTCASFLLSRGRSAWNLHGISLIASFSELSHSVEASLYGMYFLEFASYFAQEGMEAGEAKAMLNLIYLALSALSEAEEAVKTEKKETAAELTEAAAAEKAAKTEEKGKGNILAAALRRELIRAFYELRMLLIEGEYTEKPPHTADEAVKKLWQYALKAPLSALFVPCRTALYEEAAKVFIAETKSLLHRQVAYQFHSLDVLRELI